MDLFSESTLKSNPNVCTEHIDSSRGLSVSQRKRGDLAGVKANIREAHVLQYDGGVMGGGWTEIQAMYKLRRDGDAVLWVVHGHRGRAWR